MNLKKKMFGLGAVAALSLSMVTGVASADEASVAVNLKPDVCKASIAESHFSFGEWKWNDETQAYVGGVSENTFSATVRVPYSGAECPVLIKLNDGELKGTQDASRKIPGDDLTVRFTSGPLNNRQGGLGAQYKFDAPRTDVGGTITLNPTNKTYTPDRYTGTVTFMINQGL